MQAPTKTAVIIVAGIVVLTVLAFIFPYHVGFALGVYPAPAGTPWTYQLWSGFVPAVAILGFVFRTIDDAFCAEEWCFRRPVAHSVDGRRWCKVHASEHVG